MESGRVYFTRNYSSKVYLGIGLVYNRDLVCLDKIAEAGGKITSIGCRIQAIVLDYFPIFRRRYLKSPSVAEMLKAKKVLEDQGLEIVIVQRVVGHIGPRDVIRR